MCIRTNFVPESFNPEIISWIPKEPGNLKLERARPIAFQEVLKKITIGLRLAPIVDI